MRRGNIPEVKGPVEISNVISEDIDLDDIYKREL